MKEAILDILKEELEFTNEDINYSQQVLGVSIRKERGKDRVIGKPIYTARVVVKTSESPYVDGMDIIFMSPEDEVIIEANYYENTPEYQGGSVVDSLNWLRILEDIYYLQLENPFAKNDPNKVDGNNDN